jgi:hypothetical protein
MSSAQADLRRAHLGTECVSTLLPEGTSTMSIIRSMLRQMALIRSALSGLGSLV